MAEAESTRIEIGFNGGQVMSTIVTAKSADALELAVSGGADTTLNLDAEDGRYTVALSRIAYIKRFAREARVGFEK
jgi:hypothetical protein